MFFMDGWIYQENQRNDVKETEREKGKDGEMSTGQNGCRKAWSGEVILSYV